MKKAIVGGLAVLALTAAAPAQAEAAPIRECGDYSPSYYAIYNITTRIVACWRARNMARAVYHGRVNLRRGRQWWGPYLCTVRYQGIEGADVRCVRYNGGVVRWQMSS